MTTHIAQLTDDEYRAWLTTERAAIGGSDIWPLLNGKEARVWDRVLGFTRDLSHVPAIRRGIALEPSALALYAEETGEMPVVAPAHYDTERPYLRANSDALLGDDGVLEIKVLGTDSFDDFVLHGPQPGYRWQLQHYLYVRRRTRGVFAILHPERWQLHTLTVEFNALMYEQHVLPAVDAFWRDAVLTRTRPADSTRDGVEPAMPALPYMASDDGWWSAALTALRRAKEDREEAEERESRWKNELKSRCVREGRTEVVVPAVGRLTYREGTHRSFDVARYRAEHPDLDLDPWYRATATQTLRTTFNAREG